MFKHMKSPMMRLLFNFKKTSRKVLILEDDEVSLHLMKQVIHVLDRELIICGVKSVTDAKAEIEKEAPLLVVSDCLLEGGESGIEFWKFCQKRYPKTPFLLVSALSTPAIAKLAGVEQRQLPKFIQKPLHTKTLQSAVKALIEFA
jgi:DNA-binding NtrC family response regulator